MDYEPTPELLREAAQRVLDTVIPALDSVSDAPLSLTEGDPHRFPRKPAEAKAAIEGFLGLRESFDQAVAELHAAALAIEVANERGIELPPEVFVPLRPFLVSQDGRASEEGEIQPE